MKLRSRFGSHWFGGFTVLTVLAVAIGCSPAPQFVPNLAYLHKQERELEAPFNQARIDEIQTVVQSFFGTPDAPHTVSLGEVDISKALDPVRLAAAAGPTGRDKSGKTQGLYREHCAHCHGITGDGNGPTAEFLNPYPRDYRMGVFKFTSTPKGAKPTHEDLRKILIDGIPGTAMPSFKLLTDDEIESLIQYVRYLAIRGEFERYVISFCKDELEASDKLIDLELKDAGEPEKQAKFDERANTIRGFAADITNKWLQADEAVVAIAARGDGWRDPESLAASVRRGRELFYGQVANCTKCHGDSALGDGQTTDFDDWTKEIISPNATDPLNKAYIAEFIDRGALTPRNIRPRNLRLGVYRGGRRPIDIYWRIRNGIHGTPMPGALVKAADAPPEQKGLTQDDIWCLVDYVKSLPYESISRTSDTAGNVQRDRM